MTLLAGVAAGLYSVSQPQLYEARAVIAISRPRYLPNFDSRYQTVSPTAVASKAVLDIAHSDQIQVSVFGEWQNSDKRLENRQSFRSNALRASEGSDATTIFLYVKLESAEEAARLANYWADLVLDRANQLYSGQDEEQLIFFDTQVQIANENLDTAENNLAEFEGRNELEPLNNRYKELLEIQKEALRKQRVIGHAIRDAEGLLDQINNLGNDRAVPSGLSLNLTLLQLRVYGDATTPVQLQLSDSEGAQPVTAGEFRGAINSGVLAWRAQLEELGQIEAQSAASVYELQQSIQRLTNERGRLELDLQVAKEAYTTMVRKYYEVSLTIDDTSGDTKIASYSVPPQRPISRNVVRNTAIALVVGFIFSMALFLAVDWWGLEGKHASISVD